MTYSPVFLVRHGRYSSEELSFEGRTIDAPKARDELIAKNLGSGAILLTSSLARAFQTAEIIGEGIKSTPLASERIALGSNFVDGIKSLDDFIDRALEELDVKQEIGQPLVVVTHAPTLAVAKEGSTRGANDIGYGEVMEYIPGTWNNHRLNSGDEFVLDSLLRKLKIT
jgi:broad specificity phosphatase PhoE